MINKQNVTPQELMNLATGYQRARVLFALVEMEIPTFLAKNAKSLDQIARQLKIERIAADRLLNAAVALDLLERSGDCFSNTTQTQTFLVKNEKTYLGAHFQKYGDSSYPLWNDLTENLRKWKHGETNADAPEEDDQGGGALAAQHNYALLTANALAENFDFSPFARMLDLGGGTGAMSLGICEAYEDLSAIVYDLPEIIPVAAKFIRQAKLTARVKTQKGNFQKEELPADFDLALLANFVSVADENTNRKLFKRIYDCLPKNGAIVISGWMLDDARTSPLIPVLFCLEDICRRAPDVERTEKQYRQWLGTAGFKKIKRLEFFAPASYLVGYKT